MINANNPLNIFTFRRAWATGPPTRWEDRSHSPSLRRSSSSPWRGGMSPAPGGAPSCVSDEEMVTRGGSIMIKMRGFDDISLRRMLEEQGNSINIDCVDPLGRSGLMIAVENENIDVIGR